MAVWCKQINILLLALGIGNMEIACQNRGDDGIQGQET
jgi:hypothetical protein